MSFVKELVWIITLLALFTGLAGIVLPALPGLGLMALALLFHKLLLPDVLSWWTVAFGFGCAGLGFAAEGLGGVWGARRWGASKFGVAGGLVGLFWGLPGLLLGPLLGAALAELIFSRQGLKASLKAALGVGIGIVSATALKLFLGLLLLAVFACNALL